MTSLVIPTDAPVMTGPLQGHWAYEDWEILPYDGNRYEIIDGVLHASAVPSNFHQWIVKRLYRFIGIPAEDQDLAYSFVAPIGLLMPGCDPVQPDYVVILKSNAAIIADRRLRGVPNIIIEVQSPGNAAYDERVKLVAYAQAGVPEYALIDPRTRTLSHYRLDRLGRYEYPKLFSEGQSITFDCLPSLSLAIADLFAGAPDSTV